MLKFFTEVSMASNLLTRLPNITHLNANIMVLELSGNMIANSSTELQQFSSLQILDVSDNRLGSLEFLPEPCLLVNFTADYNYIASLQGPLSSCTQLRYLSLNGNEVASIPANMFAGMADLRILSLSDNPLGTLSGDVFRGPLKLNSLFLSATELTAIPRRLFSGTPELKFLYLSRNRLRDFPSQPIRELAALQELSIWGNRITELPTLSNCCPQLQKVDLDMNEVRAPSEEAVLSFVRGNASTLLLKNNPLQPHALRWALASPALQPFVQQDNCACGGLHLSHAPLNARAGVRWCVRVPCGPSATHADWIAAVNTSHAL
ncbi:hypothetical protein R5R35_003231 [Gryllus longicercus]